AFVDPFFQRLPISVSALYLVVGLLLGPGGLGLLSWDIVQEARLFEHVTEVAVIISLFTVGLTMRRSLKDRVWLLPVRLATITMVLTIAAIAAVGMLLAGLPLGAAVLLGAILAPTDPVLASDVQLREPTDRDALRYSISGEAGLNDGTAFPFVMLGLGLLGLHPNSEAGLLHLWADGPFTLLHWLGWDVAWAVTAGLVVGAATGWLIGHGALHLQRRTSSAFGLHEFMVLGLIALAYGLAELVYGYGFLAVFAAGYALRYIELRAAEHAPEPAELPAIIPGEKDADLQDIVAEPRKAAQFLAASLLDFNDKLEHLLMAAVVVLVGGVLSMEFWTVEILWLALLVFVVIRPVTVLLGLWGSSASGMQKPLIGWFGIRGIGSIYYLTYAIAQGVSEPLAGRLTGIVLALVVVSILLHGASVTPLMDWYEKRGAHGRARRSEA
ncbi:MAG TPA: cation:proton antiporter, partial [Herpetosiphonaceae bacterium]|nr:cation:proton antiporter [Herpetosiphonaceae bacterium]